VLDLLPSFGRLPPRVAALLVMALLVGAAVPLALAWVSILPPEREPFSRPDLPRPRTSIDRPSTFFLINVSLSMFAAIPRFAETLHLDSFLQRFTMSWAEHTEMILSIWFVFVPALAAAYSAVRPNPIRKHLIVGDILVLALWLLSPTLLGSLASRP
jgi:hypothetical protein